jgi:hypothetical protein
MTQNPHVFEHTGAEAVPEVARCVSALVFAYGQTGSGKTYTLLGEGFGDASHHHPITGQQRAPGVVSITFQRLLDKLKKL